MDQITKKTECSYEIMSLDDYLTIHKSQDRMVLCRIPDCKDCRMTLSRYLETHTSGDRYVMCKQEGCEHRSRRLHVYSGKDDTDVKEKECRHCSTIVSSYLIIGGDSSQCKADGLVLCKSCVGHHCYKLSHGKIGTEIKSDSVFKCSDFYSDSDSDEQIWYSKTRAKMGVYPEPHRYTFYYPRSRVRCDQCDKSSDVVVFEDGTCLCFYGKEACRDAKTRFCVECLEKVMHSMQISSI